MYTTISIIIPIYNEERNISSVITAVDNIIQTMHHAYTYEVILVNDGSTDTSWHIITRLAQQHTYLKALNLSRNFGHQAALSAGYDYATGDAIITMDADMQDPPELIMSFIDQWHQGYDIVYARRKGRGDTFIKRITARWYYTFLDYVADVSIPRNVGDFRLIDKKVKDEIIRWPERFRYLRGMVAWTGFRHTFVDFHRPDRAHGVTGYTWKKMFTLAFDGVTSFSLFPLKIAAFVGIFVIMTGSAMFGYITYDAFMHQVYYPLFKWLVTIIYIFMGIQFLLLWIIGEYIGRIFEQQKGRSLYIVRDAINMSSPHAYHLPPVPHKDAPAHDQK